MSDLLYYTRDPLCIEAADRIEQLERELAHKVRQVSQISEGWRIAEADLYAEKALGDRLAAKLSWYGVDPSEGAYAAYRKARGL